MAGIEEAVWCDGCGVEITWSPLIEGKRRYCCLDCQRGNPCRCGERMETEEERRETKAATTDLPGGLPS
ncbi:MAG TPA: hypothetical protein VI776_03670 [Anaerolineales bacterium]|nr:hypothetical protein [Anaerolineales bacterium]